VPKLAADRAITGLRLVDHRDSFVHCLVVYSQQTSAEVTTHQRSYQYGSVA
jgi:anthranilate/para-aminobenzoate synthase component II